MDSMQQDDQGGDELAQRVHQALQADRRLKGATLKLRRERGRLCLEGEVQDISAKRIACALARRTAGDLQVDDQLRLRCGERLGDGAVREALVRALMQQRELHNCTVSQRDQGQDQLLQEAHDDWPSGEIAVEVADGEVTLTGKVISLSHKRMIEALAWRTPGCCNVVDQIRVEPAEDDNDDELADAIRLMLEMDPFVRADQVGIRSEGGVVTLGGVLPAEEERHLAEMNAWSVWGVVDVRNRIEVRAP
jgi:osmotically-inducible protein OsmY